MGFAKYFSKENEEIETMKMFDPCWIWMIVIWRFILVLYFCVYLKFFMTIFNSIPTAPSESVSVSIELDVE